MSANAVSGHRCSAFVSRTRCAIGQVVTRARCAEIELIQPGSVSGVRRATREELTAVIGAKAADAVVSHFAHT